MATSRDSGRDLLESRAINLRIGLDAHAHFTRGILWFADLAQGRWDEALADAEAFVASAEGRGHYHEGAADMIRARILFARGDDDAAAAAAERQLQQGRGLGDAQVVMPALATAAYVYRGLGREHEALALAEELVSFVRRGVPIDPKLPLLGLAEPSLQDELLDAFGALPATPVTETARAIVAGELIVAADRLHAAGDLATEAEVRLLAGDGDGAVRFFRSVRATRFVEQCAVVPG